MMVRTDIKQIEQALLGGLLVYGISISKDTLSPYDFSERIHGELYELIFKFYQEEREVLETGSTDRFALFTGWLSSKGVLDKYKATLPLLNYNAAPDAILPNLAQQIKKASASNKLKYIYKQILNSEIDIEEALKEIKETIDEVETVNQANGLRKISVSELIYTQPPEIEKVFNGLPVGTVGMIAAPGGTGKSMLILEILTAVATGKDITEGAINVKKTGKCTYICLEDPEIVLHYRIHNLSAFLHPTLREELDRNLTIYTNRQIFEIVDANGIINQRNFDLLKRISEGQRLVVIDTLRRIHSADENKAGQMSALLQAFEVIAKETGTSFLLVHHTGKNTENKSRGSSVLYDNIRYQLNLEKVDKKEANNMGIADHTRAVRLVNTKSNYAPIEKEKILYRIDHGVLRLFDAVNSVDF